MLHCEASALFLFALAASEGRSRVVCAERMSPAEPSERHASFNLTAATADPSPNIDGCPEPLFVPARDSEG